MTKEKLQDCEFCGCKIYLMPLQFNDGNQIPIPREGDNSFHNCPILDFEPNPNPNDPEPDDTTKNLLNHHWLEYDTMFLGIDGVEFKNYRDTEIKQPLISTLNQVADYQHDIGIKGEAEPLPACLLRASITGSYDAVANPFLRPPHYYNNTAFWKPAALLGLLYEMDGNLEDAKKCFKLQQEQAELQKWSHLQEYEGKKFDMLETEKIFYKNKIREIDDQLEEQNQKSSLEKQFSKASKKPQTAQQKDRETKDIFPEILEFEKTDLKDFAFANMSKPEFKTTLDKMTSYYKGKKITWTDMAKLYRKINIDNLLDVQGRDDWDMLTLKNKITILKKKKINKKSPFIENSNVITFLYKINEYRNPHAHPGKFGTDKKFTDSIIRHYIDYCKNYFDKSKNA